MREFMPVDRMFLQIYEPTLGAMRTMASADVDSGQELDLLTPLPRAARDQVRNRLAEGPGNPVVIDSPESNPVVGVSGHERLLTGQGRVLGGSQVLDGEEAPLRR